MGYRKIIIAVDCDNDQEQQEIQVIAQELSQLFTLKAKNIISFYPVIKQNKTMLYNAAKIVSREGKRGLMKIIPMILKNM